MVEISIDYLGDLRCKAKHGPSGVEVITDAPVDNHGKGQSFSPTDLATTALGTCVATLMAIYAKKHDIELKGMKIRVEKHMNPEPRRIGRLPMRIEIPVALEQRHRVGLENAAKTCPVHRSLHPDIEITMEFLYPN